MPVVWALDWAIGLVDSVSTGEQLVEQVRLEGRFKLVVVSSLRTDLHGSSSASKGRTDLHGSSSASEGYGMGSLTAFSTGEQLVEQVRLEGRVQARRREQPALARVYQRAQGCQARGAARRGYIDERRSDGTRIRFINI